MEIINMKKEHWNEVSKIYEEGIKTKIATFEDRIPSYKTWDENHIEECRLVCIEDNKVIAWAALGRVSSRCVYKGVAEISIYVNKGYRGKKVGVKLLDRLINLSENNKYWTIQSSIIKENVASIKLHQKCGFRVIGVREKIARTSDKKWHDVVLMERRSKIV